MRLTIKKDKREVIGANEQIDVGGQSQHRIGGSRTDTIGSNRAITVGADQLETIGKDFSVQVGGNTNQQSAQNISLQAGSRATTFDPKRPGILCSRERASSKTDLLSEKAASKLCSPSMSRLLSRFSDSSAGTDEW